MVCVMQTTALSEQYNLKLKILLRMNTCVGVHPSTSFTRRLIVQCCSQLYRKKLK